MDREYLADLFEPFGPVAIRRMFSGFGISVDGVNFALVLRGAIYLRTDGATIARFEAEGSQPFAYTTRQRTVTVASYWRLPDRLLDEPDELVEWARAALAAAERAALAKPRKPKAAATKPAAPKATKAKAQGAKKAAKAAPAEKAARSPRKASPRKSPGKPAATRRAPAKS
ncbi:TfoX/Sxy family protein [Rhodopseudomonas telluris]|uniref:TfoX/Sxy family protein n=1 Tax=Rhodopseudomonas telluris TaxID=644215 RepID=A0ABV6EWV8_9BRAD